MERKALVLELEELAMRFSEGWHEGIKIDALDIVLLNEAAEALAQPAQEPVAWSVIGNGKFGEYKLGQTFVDYEATHVYYKNRGYELVPVYTTPPQRPWVGLTEEEIQPRLNGLPTQSIAVYARSIEAILKEKNT